MTRPFPGVDPYLELPPFWGDFSPKLLTAIQNQLLEHLLPDYDIRMEEYLMLTSEDERRHRVAPDITISTPNWWSEADGGGSTAVLEPSTLEMEYPELEPHTERHLHIIHRDSQRVVTVLELLSPANKSPGQDGLGRYLDKRNEFLASGCHLIELDLLRGGRRLPMAEPLPPGDYYALIGRVGRKPRCQVIGWSLRAKLPPIPIPLLPTDPEANLDLDAAFGLAYESSFYSRRLPYNEPLVPPVRESDVAWVQERVSSLGSWEK